MPFVATANPPAAADEAPVENDGFWPDMQPAQVRAACRLDGTVTPERLRPALQAAMLTVNAIVEPWRAAQLTVGFTRLQDVPGPTLGGRPVQALRYERAVHACLMADLAEAYRNISTLPEGQGKAGRVLEALTVQVDEHRRNQRWAISDLLGQPRSTVELI